MAKISVIMGIYNCAPTLVEALDSLYTQTFKDFKIIMCEDGSTDNTYSVAESYAANHDNIILLRNERNMGLNYTLNRCLELVDTEYCARMDGDDITLPTRFQKQVAFLDNNRDYAFVSSPMYMFDENGQWGRTYVKDYPNKKDVITRVPSFTHAALMIRTDAFKDVGGYTVDKRLLRVEDCHLWFKLYAKGYLGANLQEPLYSMRNDRDATSRRTWTSRRNGIYVTWLGYKMLEMPWYWYPRLLFHACKETAKFLMPSFIYEYFHRRR